MTVIGENIKKFRERAGYSIRKLAELSGVSKSVISEIENGKATKPRHETLVKISSALNISLETLTEMEVEHEYIITDIQEAFNVILSQENLTMDGKELCEEARTSLINSIKMAIKFAEDIQEKHFNTVK